MPAALAKISIGEFNDFDCSPDSVVRGEVSVKRGTGNLIKVGKDSRISGSFTISGNNNKILIGDSCKFIGQILVKGDNQTVVFGDYSTTGYVYILCQESCDVSIGRHCMFSRDIEIRTTDAHSLIDRATGKRTNKPGSVVIGAHVWVGVGALISKGANVPDDSVVGAKSFVTGAFTEPGVVLAGTPAKIVKSGITWNRGRKKVFTAKEMDFWR